MEFHRMGHFSQSKKENSGSLHRSRNTKGSIVNAGVNARCIFKFALPSPKVEH